MPKLTHTDSKSNAVQPAEHLMDVWGVQPYAGVKFGTEELLVLEPRTQVKRPPMYKVVMLNDDYTPMDFVVEILKSIFRHSQENAIDLMLQIHQKGAATVGVYTRDVAETKMEMAIVQARKNEYPLQCVMEKE